MTVTDGSGNSSQTTGIVRVLDTLPPTPLCQDIDVHLDSQGLYDLTAADSIAIIGSSFDSCGIASIELVDKRTYICDDRSAPIPLKVIFTDIYNNVDSCTINITVLDTIAPSIINSYADKTVGVNSTSCFKTEVIAFPIGSDACSGPLDQFDSTIEIFDEDNNQVAAPPQFDFFNQIWFWEADLPLGENDVTILISDDDNNTDTFRYVLNVVDNTPPVLPCVDSLLITLGPDGTATIVQDDVLDGFPGDNCVGLAALTIDKTEFSCEDPMNYDFYVNDNDGAYYRVNYETGFATLINDSFTTRITEIVHNGLPTDSIGILKYCSGGHPDCDDYAYQFFNIHTGDTVGARITMLNEQYSGFQGMAYKDGKYFGVARYDNDGDNYLISIDIKVVVRLVDNNNVNGDQYGSFRGLAYSPSDGVFYGATSSGINTIDPITGEADRIVDFNYQSNINITGLEIGIGNELYGVTSDGEIVQINKINGAIITVGASYTFDNYTGIILDPRSVTGSVVTVTATDNSGNQSVCMIPVTIVDNTPPSMNCIGNITAYVDEDGFAYVHTYDVDNGTTDNCSFVSLTFDESSRNINDRFFDPREERIEKKADLYRSEFYYLSDRSYYAGYTDITFGDKREASQQNGEGFPFFGGGVDFDLNIYSDMHIDYSHKMAYVYASEDDENFREGIFVIPLFANDLIEFDQTGSKVSQKDNAPDDDIVPYTYLSKSNVLDDDYDIDEHQVQIELDLANQRYFVSGAAYSNNQGDVATIFVGDTKDQQEVQVFYQHIVSQSQFNYEVITDIFYDALNDDIYFVLTEDDSYNLSSPDRTTIYRVDGDGSTGFGSASLIKQSEVDNIPQEIFKSNGSAEVGAIGDIVVHDGYIYYVDTEFGEGSIFDEFSKDELKNAHHSYAWLNKISLDNGSVQHLYPIGEIIQSEKEYSIDIDPTQERVWWTESIAQNQEIEEVLLKNNGGDIIASAPINYVGEIDTVRQGYFEGISSIVVGYNIEDFDFVRLSCDDIESSQVITMRATDAFGNQSTCTANVTILDTLAPIISVPGSVITLELDGKTGMAELDPDDFNFGRPRGGDGPVDNFVKANSESSVYDVNIYDNCDYLDEDDVTISSTLFDCDDVGATSSGVMYGFDDNDNYYSVDIVTGAITIINDDADSDYYIDMEFDPISNIALATMGDGYNEAYFINPTTGEVVSSISLDEDQLGALEVVDGIWYPGSGRTDPGEYGQTGRAGSFAGPENPVAALVVSRQADTEIADGFPGTYLRDTAHRR